MKSTSVRYDQGFQVVLDHERAQAAVMVLGPGEHTGGPDNSHRGADQCLYVVSGSGEARDGGRAQPRDGASVLRASVLRGEGKEIGSMTAKAATANAAGFPSHGK